jgi:hypothetical protein
MRDPAGHGHSHFDSAYKQAKPLTTHHDQRLLAHWFLLLILSETAIKCAPPSSIVFSTHLQMAEALVALGIAGNVVQFVDCGIRWAASWKEIYQNGTLERNNELEKVITALDGSISSFETTDDKLKEIVIAASTLTKALRHILQDLKRDDQKNRRLEAVKASYKTLRKNTRIMDIEQRLFKMRDQISAHFIFLLG